MESLRQGAEHPGGSAQEGSGCFPGEARCLTLEHGRNTGHGREHFTGDRIDMFHPGHQAFTGQDAPGVNGGDFRDQYLIPYLQIARKDYTDPKTWVSRSGQMEVPPNRVEHS